MVLNAEIRSMHLMMNSESQKFTDMQCFWHLAALLNRDEGVDITEGSRLVLHLVISQTCLFVLHMYVVPTIALKLGVGE